MPNDLYGTDIQMTSDGDLAAAPGGDLSLVTGIDNFNQAIENRLLTVPSEYLFGPYGCTLKRYVDALVTAENELAAQQDIRASLLQDDRVASVQQAVISGAVGELDAQVTVISAFGDASIVGVHS